MVDRTSKISMFQVRPSSTKRRQMKRSLRPRSYHAPLKGSLDDSEKTWERNCEDKAKARQQSFPVFEVDLCIDDTKLYRGESDFDKKEHANDESEIGSSDTSTKENRESRSHRPLSRRVQLGRRRCVTSPASQASSNSLRTNDQQRKSKSGMKRTDSKRSVNSQSSSTTNNSRDRKRCTVAVQNRLSSRGLAVPCNASQESAAKTVFKMTPVRSSTSGRYAKTARKMKS